MTAPERLLLGAIAAELKLARSLIEELAGARGLSLRVVDQWLREGWLVEAGVVYPLTPTRNLAGERAYAIRADLRASVLREFSELQLAELAESNQALFPGSLAGFVTALYSGSLARVERALPELKYKFRTGDEWAFARSMLRDAVSSPFDADWFLRTWKDAAPSVAEQVLSDALFALEPVSELYEWYLAQADLRTERSLLSMLCEHAVLRGEPERAQKLITSLPTAPQLAFQACAAFVTGDLGRATQLLNDSLGFYAKARLPECGSASVLLAMIALSSDPEGGAATAKRLLRARPFAPTITGWAVPATLTDAGRAARTLLRYLNEPEGERPRLDAHQLRADAGAWETLLLGLTAHLHERSPVTRAAWGRRLEQASKRYAFAGYAWFARQALCLAKALSPDEVDDSRVAAGSVEVLLLDAIQPKPEWRRSLDALSAFVESVERNDGIIPKRVAWFVDMVRGELNKPALEEFRPGAGWTRGRRIELSELLDVEGELPAEDARVVRAMESAGERRDVEGEVLDALCGHPRVFNGARGRLPVEVIRGTCRIETRHEHGQLVVRVEPSGATEGVNVVVDGEQRLIVYRVTAELAKISGLLSAGLKVPENQTQVVLPVLAKLAEHVEIRNADPRAHRRVVADSTPCLRISPDAGAWYVEAGVRPFGSRGQFYPPGFGRAQLTIYDGLTMLDTERNLDEEQERLRALAAECPTLAAALAREVEEENADAATVFSVALGEDALFALLVELRAASVKCELEWQNTRPIALRGKLSAASLHGSLRRIKGWYLLSGSIGVDEVSKFPLAELSRMPFTKSGRFVRLPTGDFVEVEERVRKVLSAMAACSERVREAPKELKIPEAAFGLLRSLVESDSGFDVDASAAEALGQIEAELRREYPLPATLNATLRQYQVEGYEWLRRASALELGVCLADDMGLGKTVQVIALLLERRDRGPALVVAPTSVCTNWIDELSRFAPSLAALEYTGKDREKRLARFRLPAKDAGEKAASDSEQEEAKRPDVLVVSYALLQQDIEALCSVEWHTAVLDEAQFIKNANSLRAKAAFAIPAHYRLALTGTPVENHLGDLWSIFHFLNPQVLGPWKQFQHRFLKPVERDRDTESQRTLKNLVKPFILRRTKDQVLQELPPITTLRHEVRLSEEESVRYALLRRDIYEKLHTSWGRREHKLEIFSEITRLRRFCCHPRLVFPEASVESSKIQTFLELAEELRENGHRALVFSQFVDFLELVRQELDQRGMQYLYLDGSTPKEQRSARVAAFQAGEAELFLISLKAGGFGLNLTRADYVIHLDPWWNPAVEAQATDRAHRIGQERPVTVYRLITKDTIEERIVELHQQKRAIADALLEGSDVAAKLDLDELRSLFVD